MMRGTKGAPGPAASSRLQDVVQPLATHSVNLRRRHPRQRDACWRAGLVKITHPDRDQQDRRARRRLETFFIPRLLYYHLTLSTIEDEQPRRTSVG